MAENPEFIKLLEKMKIIHEKKRDDYASGGFYENFTRQAEIISWFKADIDKAFAGFIGVKLARLATLLSSTNSPNFESIDDTFLDLATYAGLWASYYASVKIESNKHDFIEHPAMVPENLRGCIRNNHTFQGNLPDGSIKCVYCNLDFYNYIQAGKEKK